MNIYIDENLSEFVAEALNSLNKGYFEEYTVISTIEKFGRGAKDEDIIPEIGKENGVLITRDHRIRTSAQYELCKKHNLSMFFLKLPAKNCKHWEIVKLLINNWEKIIETIKTKHHPFAYYVKVRGGLEKLS